MAHSSLQALSLFTDFGLRDEGGRLPQAQFVVSQRARTSFTRCRRTMESRHFSCMHVLYCEGKQSEEDLQFNLHPAEPSLASIVTLKAYKQ